MTYMDQIKASDIVKIIKACSECGVAEIRVSDVEIKFGPYQKPKEVAYDWDEAEEPQAQTPVADPRQPPPPQIDEDFELFNDPVAWDNRMRGPEGEDL